MTSNRVFVGIPILNRADLLERCLDHLDHPAEVLVVNNNPLHQGFNHRLRRQARARGFELSDQPRNLGVAASWNLIVQTGIARGFELIFIGSNDTFLFPGSLAAVAALDKQDDEVIWHMQSWNFFATGDFGRFDDESLNREKGVAQGVVTGCALVLHARHRDVEQPRRVGEDARREPVGGRQLTKPRGFDVGPVETLVDRGQGFRDGGRQHLLDPHLEMLTEGDHPGADDGHLSQPVSSSSGWKLYP